MLDWKSSELYKNKIRKSSDKEWKVLSLEGRSFMWFYIMLEIIQMSTIHIQLHKKKLEKQDRPIRNQ